jgi:hypothetical protein
VGLAAFALPYALVRRLATAGAKLEVDPRMTESSDTSDTPAKPQDYAGLRAELATLVSDFSPLINELWPRLEDHKYRWELHSYGLAEGYDKLVVADIIGLLIEALKGHRRRQQQAHTRPDQSRRPQSQEPRRHLIKRHLIPQCLTSRSAE